MFPTPCGMVTGVTSSPPGLDGSFVLVVGLADYTYGAVDKKKRQNVGVVEGAEAGPHHDCRSAAVNVQRQDLESFASRSLARGRGDECDPVIAWHGTEPAFIQPDDMGVRVKEIAQSFSILPGNTRNVGLYGGNCLTGPHLMMPIFLRSIEIMIAMTSTKPFMISCV